MTTHLLTALGATTTGMVTLWRLLQREYRVRIAEKDKQIEDLKADLRTLRADYAASAHLWRSAYEKSLRKEISPSPSSK